MKASAKKILSMLLALTLVLGLVITPVPAQAAGDADPYIADLIAYYKNYQESAETDIQRTLEEMALVDAEQAEAWEQIMAYWSHVNTDMVVNIGTVPENLPEDNSVAIVILGFALNADGTMKDELIGRLQTGLNIANAYPNSYVVVTGGGTAANNPNVTEGGLMGEWLLEQGLAEDRLIVENKAPNTVGNAENTYKILAEEYPEVESLVMVTSDYHVPRGCILFYSKCLLAAYETGGEPLEMISNAGYYTGSNGYESISLQASGVASVAGVKASSSVTLSTLTDLRLARKSSSVAVTAIYDNGYERDVTGKAEIAKDASGNFSVSYTENGVTLTATLANVNPYIADLIAYYKNYQEAAETDIQRTLEEMALVDAEQAEAWEQIMAYWSHVNTDMVVNIGTVPENLPENNSVAIVILGFALNADGTMKDELIGRLQTGLNIANAYPNSYVVVTGGGTAANNPNVTEGGLMGEWLLEQGLAEDRLIVENKAPNTVGNAENTYKILAEEYPEVESLVMVTSDYHVPRGCILFYSKCLLAAYETGGEPLEMISNAGYYTGSNGYESISLQASGVASVAGVSASSSVELSRLTQLHVFRMGDGFDITAVYHNGYERDVTEKAVISEADEQGNVSVSYTENGVTLTAVIGADQNMAGAFSVAHLEELIAQAEAISPAAYTKDSYAAMLTVLDEAKAVLQQEDLTLADVDQAYAALREAIDSLVTLVNVAYKMPVTANCNEGNAAKVNDGTISTSSYWGSQNGSTNVPANEAELIIDLDGLYDVEAIRVYPYWSGQRIYKYELFGSVDGENWEKIAENVSDDYATTDGFTHEIDATISYVKLVGIETHVEGRPDINNIHIIELQVFGIEEGNIALNKPVRSSGSDQSAASSSGAVERKTNDGDRSTYWDAGAYANQPWVIIDLQGEYILDEVNVLTYWMRTDKRYYHYDLYASTDGENFTKIGTKDSNDAATVLGDTFDLRGQDIHATHLKVVGLYNSVNSAFHINEIRAYGSEVPEPQVIASGWSGYTNWTLMDNGVLTFVPTEQTLDGQCNLKNYWKVRGVLTLPWSEYADMITKVVVEDGIHDIGQMAFYELPNLTTVELGKDVIEVRNYAFKNCQNLTSINLENVRNICEGAFYGCTSLTDVTLNESVTVGDWAFTRSGFNPYA